MPRREVVITGMGLITPLGDSLDENWRKLRAMQTGIGYYPQNKHPERFRYLGKVRQNEFSFPLESGLQNQMKFLNRGALLGFTAAYEAANRSRARWSVVPPERRGLYIGSGNLTMVGYEFLFPAIKKATSGKHRETDRSQLNLSALNEVNPFFLLESLHNNLFSFLSAFFDLKGPNSSLAGLSPCGLQALDAAYRSIEQGEADMALVVGCGNWITDIPLYELGELGMLSRCREGVRSFKPFDRRRDGFITGEGGAALLLEDAETAKKTGAEVHGTIRGTGNCIEDASGSDLCGVPEFSTQSMTMAFDEAGCTIEDLALISPHGNAVRKGDRSELRAVRNFLGRWCSEIPFCGMKAYTAHLGAASDIAEIALGIHAVRNRMVPATLNFEETEPEFDELRISGTHQPCSKDHFLSLSRGVGGQSCSLLVEAEMR